MSNKQQRWFATKFPADAGVVEGRNHCLASPGSSDKQMTVLLLNLPFGGQDIEDFVLKRVWPQVERDFGFRFSGRGSFTADGLAQSLGRIYLVGLKLFVLPVGFERSSNLAPEVREFVVADLCRPLQAF